MWLNCDAGHGVDCMDCPAHSSQTSFTMSSAHRRLMGGYKSDPALGCLEALSLCRDDSLTGSCVDSLALGCLISPKLNRAVAAPFKEPKPELNLGIP